jgi:hypothetical protein
MIAYRAYYLDDAGCFTHAKWVRTLTDDEAIRRARKFLASSVKCELWQGTRLSLASRSTIGSALIRAPAKPISAAIHLDHAADLATHQIGTSLGRSTLRNVT